VAESGIPKNVSQSSIAEIAQGSDTTDQLKATKGEQKAHTCRYRLIAAVDSDDNRRAAG